MHTSDAVVYAKQEKLYLSHSKLMSKHKLITLPSPTLLAVSIIMYYSQCVIKATPHGKCSSMKREPCSGARDSLYKRLKKAVWSLSGKDHSFRFLKISRCFGKHWQDLSETKKKINYFNIKSEVNHLRHIWTLSKPSNAHARTNQQAFNA